MGCVGWATSNWQRAARLRSAQGLQQTCGELVTRKTQNVSDVEMFKFVLFCEHNGGEHKKSWREALKFLRESELLVGGLELQHCCFRMCIFFFFSRMLSGQVEALSQMLEFPLHTERRRPRRRNVAPDGKIKHARQSANVEIRHSTLTFSEKWKTATTIFIHLINNRT